MKSGVLLVHNEQKYLPYSLNSLTEANLDELIIVLDRCTDKSEEIIRHFQPNYKIKIFRKDWAYWNNPIAEVAEFGFSKATKDIIFGLGGDIFFDKTMFDPKFFVDNDMVGFSYLNRDLNTSTIRLCYESFLKNTFRKIDLKHEVWRGGIFGTKRKIWQKLHFRDIPSQYGEHTQFFDFKQRLLEHGGKYCYVEITKNLHLRDNALRKQNQLLQGKTRSRILKHPLWKVVLHSFLHLKPYVLIGYLNENP